MNFNFKRYFLLFLILSLLFFSLNSVNAMSDDNGFSDSLDESNMESIEKITDIGDNYISVDEHFSKECSKGDDDSDTDIETEHFSKGILHDSGNASKSSTVIYAQNMDKGYDDCEKTFKLTLNSENNEHLANKSVVFRVFMKEGFKDYGRITNDFGEAYLPIRLSPGNYSIYSFFEGDDDYLPSSRNNSVEIRKAKTYLFSSDLIGLKSTENKKFHVKLTDSNFVPLFNQTIIIGFGDKNYTKITDSNGIATLNVNIKYFGTYTFKVRFSGNSKYYSSNNTNKIQIATYIFSDEEIYAASRTIRQYVEKNHKLPSTVTIRSHKLNMTQYLAVASELICNPDQKVAPLIKDTYQNAPSPSENTSGGILNSTEYTNIFNKIHNFIYENNRAPNYDESSLGKVSINSYVYLASCILDSKSVITNNPYFVTIIPWKHVTNSSTKFFSQYDVLDAASKVSDNVERNHKLQNSISINGTQVKMAPFLKMLSTTIINIEGDYFCSVPYRNYDNATNPNETIGFNLLDETNYLTYAVDVNHFMNIMNRAPNWVTTDFGNIRFENSIYLFSKVLSYYYENDFMPDGIVVHPWNKISKNTTKFYSVDDMISAASYVKNYILQHGQVPETVSIGGKSVDINAFLDLSSQAILSIDYDLSTNLIAESFSNVNSANSEPINDVYLSRSTYLSFFNELSEYMLKNHKSPSKITLNVTVEKEGLENASLTISKNSLIYLSCDILSSYNVSRCFPDKIKFNSWQNLTQGDALVFTRDEVSIVANEIVTFVDVNYSMPDDIVVAGRNLNKLEFLALLTETIYNLENNYHSQVFIQPANNFGCDDEIVMAGSIDCSEYIELLSNIRNSISSCQFNGSNSSLGYLGVNSLIYMYSKILCDYNVNGTFPEEYVLVPWFVKINPNKIYNYDSKKVFSTLFEAIFDNETHEGDTIAIGISDNYVDTISLDKALNIFPVPDVDVNWIGDNQDSKLIFANESSGSYIADINFVNVGLLLNNTSGISIYYSNISNAFDNGISILNSSDNEIIGNAIYDSNIGVLIDEGSVSNEVSNNLIYNNSKGICILGSDNNTVEGNIIQNNSFGVYSSDSGYELNFNGISGNIIDLHCCGNKTTDIDYNWWGVNNPLISSIDSSSHIYCQNVDVGDIKWLVLVLDSYNYYDNASDINGSKILKASLKSNDAGDFYSESLPLLPIGFETNGVNSSDYMIGGVATLILNESSNGSVVVRVILDNEIMDLTVVLDQCENPIINTRNNKTYSSIQNAIDDVDTNDGDTLKIRSGIYVENIYILKRVSLTSFGDGEVIIIPFNESLTTVTILVDGSSLNNLSVYGTSLNTAVFLVANNVNIRNSNILNSYNGIYLYEVNGTNISDNRIKGCSYALYMDNSDNGSFVSNVFGDNDYGVFAKHSFNNLFKDTVLTDNWIGLEDNSKYNQYVNCSVFENYQGIRLIGSSSTYFENTSVYDNYEGIFKYASTYFNNSFDSFNNTFIDLQVANDGELVIQENMWYCGPAALSIVFESLGLSVSQEDIAGLAGTNVNGTSLAGLYQACLHYGFDSSVWLLGYDDLRVNDLVVLQFGDDYHFSIVYSINESVVTLNDPSLGLFELDNETFVEYFSGYVLDVEPISERGVKVNVGQMEHIVGVFWPVIFVGYEACIAAVVVLTGVVYLVYKLTSGSSSHIHSKLKHIKNKVKVPRKIKNPNSSVRYYINKGKKGNRHKLHVVSKVTRSISTVKYYSSNNKRSNSNSRLTKSKVAQIVYQDAYDTYLSTKNRERAKIDNIIKDHKKIQEEYKQIKRGSNSPPINSMGGVPTPKAITIFVMISGLAITYNTFSKIKCNHSLNSNVNKYLEFRWSNNDTKMTSVLILD